MKNLVSLVCAFLTFLHLLAPAAYAVEQIHFFHTDPAGTPLAITDENGDVVWRADYKPFGEEQSITTSSHENDRTFVGKEKDSESGFHYFEARYMDSSVGRFISPDPIDAVDPIFSEVNYSLLSNPQRLNPYAYGLNNPYRYIDQTGLFTLQIGLVLTGGAGGGGTVARGVVFGYSKENGFQIGFYDNVGGGGYGGVSGMGGLEVTYSGNTDINDLAGLGGTTGGSAGEILGVSVGAEVNILGGDAKPSYTVSAGPGAGPTFIETHGFVTNTRVQESTVQEVFTTIFPGNSSPYFYVDQ